MENVDEEDKEYTLSNITYGKYEYKYNIKIISIFSNIC